jgi:hypothetical protein
MSLVVKFQGIGISNFLRYEFLGIYEGGTGQSTEDISNIPN